MTELTWVQQLTVTWVEEIGEVNHGRLGKALKRAQAEHGTDLLERAVRTYAAVQRTSGKKCKLEWFVEELVTWVEKAHEPVDMLDGTMSPMLELLTRPSL